MAKTELFCAELCFKVIGRYLCWDHLSTSLAWLHGLLTFRINLSSSPEWRPNGPTFRFKNELESNKGKAYKLFAFKVPSYIYSTLHSIIHSKRLTQMELAPTTERNTLETRKIRSFLKIGVFDAYVHSTLQILSILMLLLFQAPFVNHF